mmetsp:Transcript_86453/g.241932  ORF Transcript_86453/g.241932 Transcript_86453/m.241932 type:complete len:175 (+) Transcript_86453:126-650(+)|eukprot:CAMPEP_0117494038 /NCGR_PEP_ID=MMETSP0784-20121206/19405_1 /TAXON_ID=39447 /ORGANISM="" /LENGTH=174 /DNA_ID=CAMNT_0005288905 /DNA_START=81 /DNA_END=605 /DNA_ORIENTATION=+
MAFIGGNWDRGAPTTVVQSDKQERERRKLDSTNSWECPCSELNDLAFTHCFKCGKIRPEGREARMQERASKGVGRAGGYFERDDGERRQSSSDKGEYDEFGRRATGSKNKEVGQLSKAERQKAALERLTNKRKQMPALSPPRARITREHSSRSRERAEAAKKKRHPFIFSGGIC